MLCAASARVGILPIPFMRVNPTSRNLRKFRPPTARQRSGARRCDDGATARQRSGVRRRDSAVV